MTEAEFPGPCQAGLHARAGGARGARRSLHAARGLPQAGQRALHLPARIGGRRRALRALLVHRPRLRRAHRSARRRGAPAAARRARHRRLHRARRHGGAPADPFEYVRGYLARQHVAPVPAALRFGGGLVGYFGYETVRHVEPTALTARRSPMPIGTPGHAAARVGRARGGRQRARQALPRGLRRSARSPAPARGAASGCEQPAGAAGVADRRRMFR